MKTLYTALLAILLVFGFGQDAWAGPPPPPPPKETKPKPTPSPTPTPAPAPSNPPKDDENPWVTHDCGGGVTIRVRKSTSASRRKTLCDEKLAAASAPAGGAEGDDPPPAGSDADRLRRLEVNQQIGGLANALLQRAQAAKKEGIELGALSEDDKSELEAIENRALGVTNSIFTGQELDEAQVRQTLSADAETLKEIEGKIEKERDSDKPLTAKQFWLRLLLGLLITLAIQVWWIRKKLSFLFNLGPKLAEIVEEYENSNSGSP